MTIHTRVATGRRVLRGAGISPVESDLDARLLAEHVLGWTTERFLADAGDSEPEDFEPRYRALLERRAAREPFAYIVGHREFWNLEFEVNANVLIPRPSTEFIVEAALELFPVRSAPLAVADICTGCGCVAIAIARERPDAAVIATDISDVALDVARRNGLRHGVADRVGFRRGDLLEGVSGPLDAVLANPPYVVERSRPALQPEVRDHEPSVALFGGSDGLGLITRIVSEAPSRLRSGGYLVFEFGLGQDVEIEALLSTAPELTLVDVRRDLQGIARTAVARKI